MSEPKRDPKTGTWGFITDVGRDADGRRKQARRRGFPTKKAAIEAMVTIQASVHDASWVQPDRMTFGQYLTLWLDDQRSQLRPSSHESYRRHVESHLLNHPIAQLRLQKLSPIALNALYRELARTGRRRGAGTPGLAPRTVRYVASIIHAALEDALRQQLVRTNVANASDPPTAGKSPEMAVWNADQISAFLHTVVSHRLFALWRLMAFTGARRGEALALRWRDIDFERRRMSVVQNLVPVNGKAELGPVKTDGSERTVDLDTVTLAALKSHRARQAQDRLMVGRGYRDGDLVFAQPDGSCLNPVSITATFGRLVKASGLPRIRLHDLRHSHATVMIASGVPVKVVSERLGHSSPGFTMAKYQKVLPGMQAAAVELFASAVDKHP